MLFHTTKHYPVSLLKACFLVLLTFLAASSHGHSNMLYTDYPTANPSNPLFPMKHDEWKNNALGDKQLTFHHASWYHAKKRCYLKSYRFFLRLQKYHRYLQHPLSPANPHSSKHSIKDYPRQNLLGAQADHNRNVDSIVPRLWVYASIFFFWRILRMTALQSWQAMRLLLLSICTFFLQLLLQAFRSFQLLCTLFLLLMVHTAQKVLTMPFLLLNSLKSGNNQYVPSPPDLSSSKLMRNHVPKECMILFELVPIHSSYAQKELTISSPPHALHNEREAHFWLLFLSIISLYKLLKNAGKRAFAFSGSSATQQREKSAIASSSPLKKPTVLSSPAATKSSVKKAKKSTVANAKLATKSSAKKAKKSTVANAKSTTKSGAKKTEKSRLQKGKKSTAGAPAPNPGDPSGGVGTKEGKKTEANKSLGNPTPSGKLNTANVPSPSWVPCLSASAIRAALKLLRKLLKSFPLASVKWAVKTLRKVHKGLSPIYGEDALKELVNLLPRELIEQREKIWGSLLACLTEEEAYAKGAEALSKVLNLLGVATLTKLSMLTKQQQQVKAALKQALKTRVQQELMTKTQTMVSTALQLLLLLNLLTLTGSLKSQSKDPQKRFQVKHNIILIAIKGGGGKMRANDSQSDQEIKNGIVEGLTSIGKAIEAPSKDKKNGISFISLNTYITLNLISREKRNKYKRENQKKYRKNVKSAGYQKSTEKVVGKIKKVVKSITHKNHRLNIKYDPVYAFLCFLSVQGVLKGQRLTGWKYLIDVITLSTETIHQGPRENLPAIFDAETHRKLSALLLRPGFDLSQWGGQVEKWLRSLAG